MSRRKLNVNKQAIGYGYFIIVILLCIYIICKSGTVVLEKDNHAFIFMEFSQTISELGEDLINEMLPVRVNSDNKDYLSYISYSIKEILPVTCYVENYGFVYDDMYASREIPEYFYEYEDMSEVEALNTINKESLPNVTNEQPINNTIGTTFVREQLADYNFLINNIYVVESTTSLKPEEIAIDKLLDVDLSVDLTSSNYKVLIYHTHGSEDFADSRAGVTEDTIIGVGDELTRILEEQYGVKVYHDRTVYDTVDGVLDRNYAYTLARKGVEKILAENPSIEVVIDLHRDGVGKDRRLVTDINGKPTAQIMFLNGVSRMNVNGDIDYLYNPNKQTNLAFSFQMYLQGKEMYGDYLRKIYIKGLRYNLDMVPRAVLVEAGAQTNTVEEEKNAMEPLASIIFKVLSGSE